MNKNDKYKNTGCHKWERKYEDDYKIIIWKFNSNISLINPYEIDIKEKPEKKKK